ncbi:MAG: ATP-binding protein [Gammaproteobacteria bacterium]|nr:ATP-binding protein [Gammaproteobacteria bacterium]
MVGRLGGDQLYGADADVLKIALRELIQNAADAIVARRLVDSSSFEGHIRVRLLLDGSRRRLQVDDDGVGMSSQTLSQDLLDFGKSFWASERASSEFPGIHAARLTPIGRFGIGFLHLHGSRKGKGLLQTIRQCP